MSVAKRIVCFDAVTRERGQAMIDNVPPGFELVFAELLPEEGAIAAVADADYVISTFMPTRIIEAARKVKLIQKIGEGTDKIDVATAARLGIPVAKTAGSASHAVAEMATALMLATLRRLPQAHIGMMSGKWLRWQIRPGAQSLRGKQIGIVGLGKIGKIVAEIMHGFRASVVYYDVVRLDEAEEARRGVRFLPMDDLVRTSDVVTVHVPLIPSTRGLIGRRELALMKPTAIVVNSCRGGVVDEEALYEALRDKRIMGAGMDDFVKEPPGPNHPFTTLDNIVLTPHLGGGTDDAELEGVKHAMANIARFDRGEPLDPQDIAPVRAAMHGLSEVFGR